MSAEWLRYLHEHPRRLLFIIFVAWKSLIVLVVLASPGVGYDTSTSLLPWYDGGRPAGATTPASPQSQWLKFVRWDAVYFTHMADQGHVYEQEWAFGMGLSSVISWVGRNPPTWGFLSGPDPFVVAGVIMSHIAHWLAVIILFELSTDLVDNTKNPYTYSSFTAAALYVFSPAGIFLSAPSTESIFAVFSFAGFRAYLLANHHFNHAKVVPGCLLMIMAGVSFGMATLIRSNGILAGIPFAIEAVTTSLLVFSKGFSVTRLSRLASVVVGGIFVGIGMAAPQFIAYREYCAGQAPGDRRPWCEWTIPSIFTFVQSYYWNVGPFRYWTLSNAPLFLLAAPTLWLLTQSAVEVLRDPSIIRGPPSPKVTSRQISSLAAIALPQLLLAILALSSYHVQIITRISSGYPLWYIWLATKAMDEPKRVSIILRWMIMYALVQAGLYASFLPPA